MVPLILENPHVVLHMQFLPHFEQDEPPTIGWDLSCEANVRICRSLCEFYSDSVCEYVGSMWGVLLEFEELMSIGNQSDISRKCCANRPSLDKSR